MVAAAETNFGWFRYTCEDGTFRAVKTDALWGANAASGLLAYNPADAPFPSRSRRYRPRRITLQDNTTGRTTTRIVGTVAATAWTTAAFTTPITVKGLQTPITYSKIGTTGEKIPRPKTEIPKAEATAAT